MKTIEAYQSVDGSIHLNEQAAIARDEDEIGSAIDALLAPAVAACNGNVTRNDQCRMALYLLKNRQELASRVRILNAYLNEQED